MALRSEQLVSRRQWWNRALLVAAMVIVVATLWYANSIADRIRQEEQSRVRVWSEAIRQRAELVRYTQALFEELREEEREKADRLADASALLATYTLAIGGSVCEALGDQVVVPKRNAFV